MTIHSELFDIKQVIQRRYDALSKVEDWAVAGLLDDEGHHKQYCLEQILLALGIDLAELRTRLSKDDYEWEPGIAP